MTFTLTSEQVVPDTLNEVWKYFATPENLNEMTPDSMVFEITHGYSTKMYQGQLIGYRIQILPLIKSNWLTEISHIQDKAYFVDEQRSGPYKFWYHEHKFEETDDGVKISDKVTYQLPFGFLGHIVNFIWVRHQLKYIFDFRSNKIREIFGETQ